MNDARETGNTEREENSCTPDKPDFLTLEGILDATGEIGHLNDLVMLCLEKEGGFTSHEGYFAVVHPLLDLLEVEIRVRGGSAMSNEELKLVIRNWIDDEIAKLQ